MSVCAFCELAAAPQPWMVTHREGIVSFKPFGALTPKHRMFIPRQHLTDAASDPEVTGLLFQIAAEWASGQIEPFNLVANSGDHAGQTVFHLHIHYIPRYKNDGLLHWGEN